MKKIVIKLQVEGTHHWPNCDIKEVEFLKYPHRHIFYIRLEKEVTHNDRDVEIIKLKREVQDYLEREYFELDYFSCQFNSMSCEDIAEALLNEFDASLVEVLEDNENGAIITK